MAVQVSSSGTGTSPGSKTGWRLGIVLEGLGFGLDVGIKNEVGEDTSFDDGDLVGDCVPGLCAAGTSTEGEAVVMEGEP